MKQQLGEEADAFTGAGLYATGPSKQNHLNQQHNSAYMHSLNQLEHQCNFELAMSAVTRDHKLLTHNGKYT